MHNTIIRSIWTYGIQLKTSKSNVLKILIYQNKLLEGILNDLMCDPNWSIHKHANSKRLNMNLFRLTKAASKRSSKLTFQRTPPQHYQGKIEKVYHILHSFNLKATGIGQRISYFQNPFSILKILLVMQLDEKTFFKNKNSN